MEYSHNDQWQIDANGAGPKNMQFWNNCPAGKTHAQLAPLTGGKNIQTHEQVYSWRTADQVGVLWYKGTYLSRNEHLTSKSINEAITDRVCCCYTLY